MLSMATADSCKIMIYYLLRERDNENALILVFFHISCCTIFNIKKKCIRLAILANISALLRKYVGFHGN